MLTIEEFMKLYGFKRDQFWVALRKYLEEYNAVWYSHNHSPSEVHSELSKI